MDSQDHELINALKDDTRMTYKDLASRLGVAEGTVRNRLTRLLESRTLRLAPIVDQAKLGFRFNAWLGVRCRPGTSRSVARALAKYHAVRYSGATTGTYDVICEAIFRTQAEMLVFLEDDVASIDGIAATDSSVVLEIAKLGYEWELDERAESVLGNSDEPNE